MNYRSIIRAELSANYRARGFRYRGQSTTTENRVSHVSGTSAAWDTQHDVAPATYEEAEASFWSDADDDEDMHACMF